MQYFHLLYKMFSTKVFMFLRTVSVSLETYLPSALYPDAHDISLNSWTLSLIFDNLFNKAFSVIFPEMFY